MYKYRSTCRHNMLVHYNGQVAEIRPNQEFESKSMLSLPYLKWMNPPAPPKRGRPKKVVEQPLKIKKEELNVSDTRKSED